MATTPISPEELEDLREAFSKIGERADGVAVISSLCFFLFIEEEAVRNCNIRNINNLSKLYKMSWV